MNKSTILDYNSIDFSKLLNLSNKSIDAYDIQQAFKSNSLAGSKSIYDQLVRCKLLRDPPESTKIQTHTKQILQEFAYSFITKEKSLKNHYSQVTYWNEACEESIEVFFKAVNTQNKRPVSLKLIHALGMRGVRFTTGSRKVAATSQLDAYRLIGQYFHERDPYTNFDYHDWAFLCEGEPVFYLIELPSVSAPLIKITKGKQDEELKEIIKRLAHDIFPQIFVLHRQNISLYDIRMSHLYFNENHGFIILDLNAMNQSLCKSELGPSDKVNYQSISSYYLEETNVQFKTLGSCYSATLPPDAIMSKLNEKVLFNPFKFDIYQFALIMLEILCSKELSKQFQALLYQLVQTYEKGDLATLQNEANLKEHFDIFQKNDKIDRVKLLFGSIFYSNFIYDSTEKKIFCLSDLLFERLLTIKSAQRINSFEVCDLLESKVFYNFTIHPPNLVNKFTPHFGTQYYTEINDRPQDEQSVKDIEQKLAKSSVCQTVIEYPNGIQFKGLYDGSLNLYGNNAQYIKGDKILYKGLLSDHGLLHGKGQLFLTYNGVGDIVYDGCFDHNLPVQGKLTVKSKVLNDFSKDLKDDSYHLIERSSFIFPDTFWVKTLLKVQFDQKMRFTTNYHLSQSLIHEDPQNFYYDIPKHSKHRNILKVKFKQIQNNFELLGIRVNTESYKFNKTSSRDLIQLLKNNKQLKMLAFKYEINQDPQNWDPLYLQAFQQVIKDLESVQTLKLIGSSKIASLVLQPGIFLNLQELQITQTQRTRKTYSIYQFDDGQLGSFIERLTQLQKLTLVGDFNFDLNILKKLRVQDLQLVNNQLDKLQTAAFVYCQHMKSLSLCNTNLSFQHDQALQTLIESLQFTKIRALDFSGTSITSQDLIQLFSKQQFISGLETLYLNNCRAIHYDTKFITLTQLLSNSKITSLGLLNDESLEVNYQKKPKIHILENFHRHEVMERPQQYSYPSSLKIQSSLSVDQLSLNLTRFGQSIDILSFCHQRVIKDLTLQGDNLDDSLVEKLLSVFLNLTKINLRSSQLTSKVLSLISNCSQVNSLTELHLQQIKCPQNADTDIQRFFNVKWVQLQKLTLLILSERPYTFDAKENYFGRLRTLKTNIKILIGSNPSIRKITLIKNQNQGQYIDSLTQFQLKPYILDYLTVQEIPPLDMQIVENLISNGWIQKMQALQLGSGWGGDYFSYEKINKLQPEIVLKLLQTAYENLQYIDFSGLEITTEMLEAFGKNESWKKSLKVLNFRESNFSSSKQANIFKQCKWSGLIAINFEQSNVDDQILIEIAKNPMLQTLKKMFLSNCSYIQGQGIEAFLDNRKHKVNFLLNIKLETITITHDKLRDQTIMKLIHKSSMIRSISAEHVDNININEIQKFQNLGCETFSICTNQKQYELLIKYLKMQNHEIAKLNHVLLTPSVHINNDSQARNLIRDLRAQEGLIQDGYFQK